MKRAWNALFFAAIAAGLAACDHHDHDHGSHDHGPAPAVSAEGGNAVQNEMRLLHTAMRDAVTAIAMDDLASIPPSLHRVHMARDLTDKAVASGSYKPPKNPDRVKEFRELDEAFHAELVKLLGAARANDSKATAAQLGVVLGKCSGCHADFRR